MFPLLVRGHNPQERGYARLSSLLEVPPISCAIVAPTPSLTLLPLSAVPFLLSLCRGDDS